MMTRVRIAYMPLATYPEVVGDSSIHAATAFAASLECEMSVTTFSVDIPQISSPLGNLLLDVPGLIKAAEDKSRAESHRLHDLVLEAAGAHFTLHCTNREVVLGGALDAAAAEARRFDLTVVPWSGQSVASQDMGQAIVFGSGRPAILVPRSTQTAIVNHVAIAWDGSRVAARALGDALPLLAEGGRVSVLTVRDEKPLIGSDIAGALVSSLEKRGFSASAVEIDLGDRPVARALQDSALSEGVQLLAMGGFGHSRLRDFVLGGATKGVLTDLRLPVLLSH